MEKYTLKLHTLIVLNFVIFWEKYDRLISIFYSTLDSNSLYCKLHSFDIFEVELSTKVSRGGSEVRARWPFRGRAVKWMIMEELATGCNRETYQILNTNK